MQQCSYKQTWQVAPLANRPNNSGADKHCCTTCRSSTVARKPSSVGAIAETGCWSLNSSSSKYERIAAFVDAHATPMVPAAAVTHCFSGAELEQPASWHNSYDEEAEEGELCDEPHLLQLTQQVSAVAAGHAAAMAASAGTATDVVHSWSYGNSENPKPWCYSWDEEAEGAFELSECGTQTVQQLRAQRRAALHEARHAARATRKMRRAQLHPQLGDLEHMQAWVGEDVTATQQLKTTQRSMPSVQYQQLLALVAGDSAHRQYRKPKQWHLTFDEECHGDAPETILGSC